MANTGETMDQKAKRAAADAKSGAAEFADTARERAREMADEAKTRAYDYGREYKNEAANETSKIAEALRKAADDLHDGSPQERIFAKLADTVADTADGIRDMELDEMAYAVNDFARRNQAAFLGGAALLGFVAARFMKASARHDDHRIGSYGASGDYGRDDRYSPDVTPNDYDDDDRVSRPVPTSSPTTSAAPRPAPTGTTQSTARPAATGTGGTSGAASTGATTGTAGTSSSAGSTGSTGSAASKGSGSTGSTGSVGGIDKPDEKPEIPGAPQPGTTGAVKK
ncbi:hypothetical protein [Limimaricola soesokkakensis]|uniref:hypothetical protein n=1 Tax=Limimaricola soesokkakensis TaxID=1343159 RepID=UPI0035175BAC